LALVSNFDGKIHLNLVNNFKDEAWERKMEEVLNEYGVKYEMKECKTAPNIKFDSFSIKVK